MLRDWPISHILECESSDDFYSKSWFLSMIESHVNCKGLPDSSWMHDMYKWGPTRWPVKWSDFVHITHVDCGVFADLTQIAYTHCGFACARMQSIVVVKRSQVELWRKMWADEGLNPANWIIDENHVYHELVAFRHNDDTIVFDSTEGHPVEYGTTTICYEYMRLCEPFDYSVKYNERYLKLHDWTKVN